MLFCPLKKYGLYFRVGQGLRYLLSELDLLNFMFKPQVKFLYGDSVQSAAFSIPAGSNRIITNMNHI